MSNRTEEEFQANLGNLLNQRWGELLGQRLVDIEQFKFQTSQQMLRIQEMAENEISLTEALENTKRELHQAQIDLIAARGKNIIDDTDNDTERQ